MSDAPTRPGPAPSDPSGPPHEDLGDTQSHDSAAIGGPTQTASWPTPPAARLLDAPVPVPTIPGYRIIRLLGEGGMGRVYAAERERPHGLVALKLIRAAHLSKRAMDRFELEQDALARLEHPGIARIFHADFVPSDLGPIPYFVMELVKGQKLTTYANEKRLTLPQRLELAAQIADAVQHAHFKSIIHRDLKPGNILVTENGSPKVLDFGLALMAKSETLTESGDAKGEELAAQPDPAAGHDQTPGWTEVGKPGTPYYMSPEQFTEDYRALDTRTDIYSLGVVLFELLTGRLPYDFENKSSREIERMIREDPPTPLTRAAGAAPGMASNGALRGDVEAIVHKAMNKDRSKRYDSAAALAADIRRHLRHEPITAAPSTAWTQIRKFARRHRLGVGSACGMVLALAIAAVGMSVAWSREAQHRRDAQKALTDARAAREREVLHTIESAGKQGAWRSALANIDIALGSGFGTEIDLRLSRIRALDALNRTKEAMEEADRLGGRADLGENRGPVLMWRGDLLLANPARFHEGIDLLRQALAAGLPASDEYYVRALVSDSLLEKAALLEKTLAVDPVHGRARTLLAVTLSFLGRLGDAENHLEINHIFQPNDPGTNAARAILAALRGERANAQVLVDELRALAPVDVQKLGGILDALCAWRNQVAAKCMAFNPSLADIVNFVAIAYGITGMKGETIEDVFGGLRSFGSRPFEQSWGTVLPCFMPVLGGSSSASVPPEELLRIVEQNPEGVMKFVVAQLLKDVPGYRLKAIELGWDAVDTPMILPVRTQAIISVLSMQAETIAFEGGQLSPADKARIITGILEVYANPSCDAMVKLWMVDMARVIHEYELAYMIACRALNETPNHQSLVQRRESILKDLNSQGQSVNGVESTMHSGTPEPD